MRIISVTILAALLLTLTASPYVAAQSHITTPKEELGFNFGDDYQLANYKQISAYWRKFAGQSNRITETCIGRGKVLLFNPKILQRAQPHGTFKLLFNSIFYSTQATK